MDKNLTDAEIIKALELCQLEDTTVCETCPLGKLYPYCDDVLAPATVDLINRLQEKVKFAENINHLQMEELQSQKAENERLKGYNENLQTANTSLSNEILDIKAEAYKECIKKVKEEIAEALKSNYRAIQGRIAYYEKEGDMFVGDEFVDYCNGKVDCLRGLDDFLDNLLKELVDNNG